MVLPRELGSDWQLLELIELIGLVAVRQVTSRDGIRKDSWLPKHAHEILTGHARIAQESWSLASVSC